MGLPVKEQSSAAEAPVSQSQYSHSTSNGNLPASGFPSGPSHVFVYGNSRPDIPGNEHLRPVDRNRAWLLGGRLYSFQRQGIQRAAVRLEEPGHAVFGYVMSANSPSGVERLLDDFERQEFSRDLYERDVVEITTERGERLQSYVYHRPDVDQSNPVPRGDWLQRPLQ
eukprot:c21106_g1_i1 orf=289-792(+)